MTPIYRNCLGETNSVLEDFDPYTNEGIASAQGVFNNLLKQQIDNDQEQSGTTSGDDHEEEQNFLKMALKEKVNNASRQKKQDNPYHHKEYVNILLDRFFTAEGMETQVSFNQMEDNEKKGVFYTGMPEFDKLRIEITNTALKGCVLILSGSASVLYVTIVYKNEKQKALLEKWHLRLKKHLISGLSTMRIIFSMEEGESRVI